MIKQFHVESRVIFNRVSELMIERPPVYSNDRKRNGMIRDIQRKRRALREFPPNEWRVYDLCKQLEVLLEHDGGGQESGAQIDWFSLIRKIIPFVPRAVIANGVKTFTEALEEQKRAEHIGQ